MAIDFPTSPTNGQLYTNPTTGMVYSYSSAYTSWQPAANSAVGYTGSVGAGYTGSVGYAGSIGSLGYSGSIGYTGSIGDIGLYFASKSIIM